jgi:hypothetical protein
MWCARTLGPALIRSAYLAGTVLHRPRLRMLGLREAAERELLRDHRDAARRLAGELLVLANRLPRDWNYGNAIHHGHLLLGRLALAEGDLQEANRELLAAATTPGSPQLNSFGPNCRLACDLLKAGQVMSVLAYLEACGAFWKVDLGRRAEWMREIRENRTPDFGGNLLY